MDVARMNFSHGDHATHRQAAMDVRAAAEAEGLPIALLGDLQGPKIRTGPLETAFQRLVRGRVVFLTGEARSAENEIEVSHPELVDALHPGKVTGGLFDHRDVVDGVKHPHQQFRAHIDPACGRVVVHHDRNPESHRQH